METKRFSLRVILTVVTGRLLTERKSAKDNGIGDLYEILAWMTNDEPYTHVLVRFADECRPYLLEWFPALKHAISDLHILDKKLKSNGDPEDGIKIYLDWLRKDRELLPFYDVPKIPRDDHTVKDPIAELKEMGIKNPIVISPASEE